MRSKKPSRRLVFPGSFFQLPLSARPGYHSRLKSKYFGLLQSRAEIAAKLDESKALQRELSPLKARLAKGSFLKRRAFQRMRKLQHRHRQLVMRLSRLGLSLEEQKAFLEGRKSAVLEFNKSVKAKLAELAGTPERKQKLSAILEEISQWNFVRTAQEANLHALAEVRVLERQGKW